MKVSDLMKDRIECRAKYQKVIEIMGQLNDLLLKPEPTPDFMRLSEQHGKIFNAALLAFAMTKTGVELFEADLPDPVKCAFMEAISDHLANPDYFLKAIPKKRSNKTVAVVFKDGKLQPLTAEELNALVSEITKKHENKFEDE